MLVRFINRCGVLQNAQRIYDAQIEPRKKTMRPISTITGAAVRLSDPAEERLGIAEGVGTALAALELFGIPCWAAFCAHGIETFEPPPEIRRLIVFGDNDSNSVGQAAEYALAKRLAKMMEVEVRIPPVPGSVNQLRTGTPPSIPHK
jgi:putative DNA primase/helicase